MNELPKKEFEELVCW